MDSGNPDLYEALRVAFQSFGTRKAYKPSACDSYITYHDAFHKLKSIALSLRPFVTMDRSRPSTQAKIGVLMNNCPAFLNAFWCAAALRAVVTPLNNRYHYILNHIMVCPV